MSACRQEVPLVQISVCTTWKLPSAATDPQVATRTPHRIPHMTSDVQARDKLKARGVDMIAVVTMDTPFAMHAWANQLTATEEFVFLSDVSGQLAKSLGTTFQAGAFGLRPTRYGAFHHYKLVYPTPPPPAPLPHPLLVCRAHPPWPCPVFSATPAVFAWQPWAMSIHVHSLAFLAVTASSSAGPVPVMSSDDCLFCTPIA